MRKLLAFAPLFCVLLLSACQSPTENERRSLAGHWTSTTLAATTVRMTITEVARSVEGAGSWVDPNRATAFAVSGAHAEESVSLLFEFRETPSLMPNVNFLGVFRDKDTLEGTFTGGAFRGVPVTFVRLEKDD